uniref:Uncharacterized protein n=1 Tax=Oryza sativa subsp. japonica TaxID=39947 RepID=Q6YZ59_ORYSJ|nr:hypothetical protein [Oryza sativa Japonica Group]BAD17370.1 hypothetical protein [Oryza sativa Japonica Group]
MSRIFGDACEIWRDRQVEWRARGRDVAVKAACTHLHLQGFGVAVGEAVATTVAR